MAFFFSFASPVPSLRRFIQKWLLIYKWESIIKTTFIDKTLFDHDELHLNMLFKQNHSWQITLRVTQREETELLFRSVFLSSLKQENHEQKNEGIRVKKQHSIDWFLSLSLSRVIYFCFWMTWIEVEFVRTLFCMSDKTST